jgi:hypothetical protein
MGEGTRWLAFFEGCRDGAETSGAEGGIPGFPMESILVGLIVALAILVVLRRRRTSLRTVAPPM